MVKPGTTLYGMDRCSIPGSITCHDLIELQAAVRLRGFPGCPGPSEAPHICKVMCNFSSMRSNLTSHQPRVAQQVVRKGTMFLSKKWLRPRFSRVSPSKRLAFLGLLQPLPARTQSLELKETSKSHQPCNANVPKSQRANLRK